MICEGSGSPKVEQVKEVLCCCGQVINTKDGKVIEHERTGPIVNGCNE